MGILSWVLMELVAVAGIIGKVIMPGRDPGGIIRSIRLGIAGALLWVILSAVLGFDSRTLITIGITGLGSIVILALYRMAFRQRTA